MKKRNFLSIHIQVHFEERQEQNEHIFFLLVEQAPNIETQYRKWLKSGSLTEICTEMQNVTPCYMKIERGTWRQGVLNLLPKLLLV